jgi:hypothetical protein
MQYHSIKSLYACLLIICVILPVQGCQNDKLPEQGTQADRLTFSGRVVNRDGVPVAGAEVLYAIELDRLFVRLKPAESVGRTAANGKFRFEIPHPEPEAGKVVNVDGKPIARARVKIHPEEDPATGYQYGVDWTNVQGEFKLEHIKDAVVSLHVAKPGVSYYPTDHDNYQTFEVAVNQRNLVLTLTLDGLRPGK